MNQLTDKRQALPKYTVLDFGSEGPRGYSYTITAESGRGASCIVYQGYYENSLGEKKTVFIKECYPFSLKMNRLADGKLSCEDDEAFESHKKRFKDSFSLCNRIFETEGLTNTTSNYMDIHEKNGTLYTVITYRQGQELSLSDKRPLKETIRIIKSAAKAIRKIHDNGYLYLDTKPDNVFVLDEMNESVELFDFDSMIPIDAKGDMKDYRLSYSKGFAPLEQRNGRLDQICEATDVYGIGALLFYMVFGRIPEAPDCDPFASYDYSKTRYEFWKYRDRLITLMSEFFRNSLAVMVGDRYQKMDSVIDCLEDMEKDADLTKPFICDTYYPVIDEMIGREPEKSAVKAFLWDDQRKCLLVTGMGGIGKSTLVRTCLSESKEDLDLIVYLYFHGSIMETVCDDSGFAINTAMRDPDESMEEYFARKLDLAKRIVGESRVVLVLDDFSGDPGDDFLALLNVGWRVILISRERIDSDEWETVRVEEMKEPSETQGVFRKYLKRDILDDECEDVDGLIHDIKGHTLTIELIAKQIRRSRISVREARDLVVSKGLTLMTQENVPYSRDGSLRMRHTESILRELILREHMRAGRMGILKALALYSQSGVREDVFMDLMGNHVGGSENTVRSDLYELNESGWINRGDNHISVHPVIRETVLGMDILPDESRPVKHMINRIAKGIVDLGAGNRYGDKSELRGSVLLAYASAVITQGQKVDKLRQTKEYYRLFCPTILELPRDNEDGILVFTDHLTEAWEYANPLWLIRVVDYACYILYDRNETESAIDLLVRSGVYAEQVNDPRLLGMYYDTMTQFYDTLLEGEYDVDDPESAHFRKKITESVDKAILHMYRAMLGEKKRYIALGIENKEISMSVMYLAELHLTKAIFDIRSYPVKLVRKSKIRNHISTARKIILGMPNPDYHLIITYELTVGWYYTMVEPDAEKTGRMLKKAMSHENPWPSVIDYIDFCLVPCAEMIFRHGDSENARTILESAVEICDNHAGIAPFERKRVELIDHIEDVVALS